MEGFQTSGSISLANFTTTAYLPAKAGKIKSQNAVKESGKFILQMGSADLSGAVVCTLQVSANGAYWANAQEDGADITFSLSTTTPVVELITAASGLFWRIAVTINSKTGVIDYFVKDVV